MLPLINAERNGKGVTRRAGGEFSSAHQPLQTVDDVQIRGYRASDLGRIRQLCCDTGFLGQPIDPVFQDRELFADLFTGAYLEHEPEWALVAEANGRVVGYLLGSVGRHFDFILMRHGFPIAAKMLWKLMSGRYHAHPRSRRFVRWLLTAGYQEQPKHPRRAAHLHLDLESAYRGRGIGLRLWHHFAQRLVEAGITRCYGAFFSYPGCRPETAYARYGFNVFDRKATTLFHPEVSDVEVVCVSKALGGPEGFE